MNIIAKNPIITNYGYIEKSNPKKKKCYYCKEKFIRFNGQLIYKADDHIFCSWNCKRKYLKEAKEQAEKEFKLKWLEQNK